MPYSHKSSRLERQMRRCVDRNPVSTRASPQSSKSPSRWKLRLRGYKVRKAVREALVWAAQGQKPERKKGLQLKWALERDLAADCYIHRGIRPTLQKRAEAGLQTVSPSSLTSVYFTGGRWFLTPAGLGST